jgi:hypothetical protein
MKKTQFFSVELVLVMITFLVVSFVSLLVWWEKTNEYNNNVLDFDMQLAASNMAETLLVSSGKPFNWDTNRINHVGVSDDYYIINDLKLDYLLGLSETNYSLMKELLGAPEYDYFIIIEDLSGNVVLSFANYSSFSKSVVWQEKVIMNDEVHVLKVGVVI